MIIVVSWHYFVCVIILVVRDGCVTHLKVVVKIKHMWHMCALVKEKTCKQTIYSSEWRTRKERKYLVRVNLVEITCNGMKSAQNSNFWIRQKVLKAMNKIKSWMIHVDQLSKNLTLGQECPLEGAIKKPEQCLKCIRTLFGFLIGPVRERVKQTSNYIGKTKVDLQLVQSSLKLKNLNEDLIV